MEVLSKVADGVFCVSGQEFCSNIYVLLDGKRALLIDAGSGSTQPALDGILANCKLEKVLLTHGHADHTNGMNYISADGFLHKADLKMMKELNFFLPNYKMPNNIFELGAEPVKFGNFELEVLHTPGHTEGSVCFYERKQGLLFSGDTKFAGGDCGRTDLPGGNQRKLEESLRRLEGIKRKKLCPGHGEIE